jgi:hypothetical protein
MQYGIESIDCFCVTAIANDYEANFFFRLKNPTQDGMAFGSLTLNFLK